MPVWYQMSSKAVAAPAQLLILLLLGTVYFSTCKAKELVQHPMCNCTAIIAASMRYDVHHYNVVTSNHVLRHSHSIMPA